MIRRRTPGDKAHWGLGFRELRRHVLTTIATMGAVVLAAGPATASTSLEIEGSYSAHLSRPDYQGRCLPDVAGDECAVVDLGGLGIADLVYIYGPTFERAGRSCFDVDGTFTLTLRSDNSNISGPSTGRFCVPGNSGQQRGTPSYGNPQDEHDSIDFADGTGQFAGLHGTVAYSEWNAGAHFEGKLTGRLTA